MFVYSNVYNGSVPQLYCEVICCMALQFHYTSSYRFINCMLAIEKEVTYIYFKRIICKVLSTFIPFYTLLRDLSMKFKPMVYTFFYIISLLSLFVSKILPMSQKLWIMVNVFFSKKASISYSNKMKLVS